MITVELHGLRMFGRHGVNPEEREHGQEFVFDVELDVGSRGSDDRIEHAVSYSDVARAVRDASDARAYDLLEALAAAVADELERRFAPERIRVRVAKPEIRPAGMEGTPAVTLTRP